MDVVARVLVDPPPAPAGDPNAAVMSLTAAEVARQGYWPVTKAVVEQVTFGFDGRLVDLSWPIICKRAVGPWIAAGVARQGFWPVNKAVVEKVMPSYGTRLFMSTRQDVRNRFRGFLALCQSWPAAAGWRRQGR